MKYIEPVSYTHLDVYKRQAFGSELDGILPDLEGSVAERLGTAMHNAMSSGVDVENWDLATATEWLDLDGLSAETQAAITEMMSQVAASMPDQMTSALEGTCLLYTSSGHFRDRGGY